MTAITPYTVEGGAIITDKTPEKILGVRVLNKDNRTYEFVINDTSIYVPSRNRPGARLFTKVFEARFAQDDETTFFLSVTSKHNRTTHISNWTIRKLLPLDRRDLRILDEKFGYYVVHRNEAVSAKL